MTAWPSFDVTISPFSQSVQKYYNNFACARFYFERIGNKCFHRGESRGIDLLPYKEERYISSFWNEKTRITLSSSPVFCYAKYRGGVRRTEGLENTDSGSDRVTPPLPPCVPKEIGGVPVGWERLILTVKKSYILSFLTLSYIAPQHRREGVIHFV